MPDHLRAFSNSHQLAVKALLALLQGSPIRLSRRESASSLTKILATDRFSMTQSREPCTQSTVVTARVPVLKKELAEKIPVNMVSMMGTFYFLVFLAS